jgi:hypothetical protein
MIAIEGPLSLFSISLIGRVLIGAKVRLDIEQIWFGYIVPVGRRGIFYLFK